MGLKRRLTFAFTALLILTFALPASAQLGTWKADQTHRPRLLWEAGEWSTILSRLAREPYITLYNRVKSSSNGTPAAKPQYYNPSREYGAANIAKNAAFVWAVEGDTAKAEKAALILEDMPVEFNWPDVSTLFWLLDYDIHTAEAMQGYLAAFDILAGTGYLNPTREQAIHDHLETLCINAWNFYYVDWYLYRHVLNFANHFTKLATAFGTAAITLNDSPYALDWINQAMAWGIYKFYHFTVTDEGAYTEGPGYWVYTQVNVVPFFLQYDKFTGGEDATFKKRKCNIIGKDCTYEDVFVENPMDDPRLEALARWTVDIRLPNGMNPPFDDSNSYANFNGLFAGAWADAELAWDWAERPVNPLSSKYCSDIAVDLICIYDDTITPAEPTHGPSVVFDEDGYAIFRTDWGEDAFYAMFLAEAGKAQRFGMGHEPADTLSFMFYAHGQLLAIDPGYIKWGEHYKVRYGIDHNVVAIDGSGPPANTTLSIGGIDGDIRQWNTQGSPEFVIGSTRYSKTDWTRGLFFYGDYILVGDYLDSDKERTFEFLLHGHGGGDSGGTFGYVPGGVQWEINGVTLDLVLTGSESITESNYLDYHGWTWNQSYQHEVFAGAMDAKRGGYAAALVAQTDAKLPTSISVMNLPAGCGALQIVDSGVKDYLVTDRGTETCEVTQDNTDYGVEAGTAWLRPEENRAVAFGAEIAFYIDDQVIAWQTGGKSMVIEWGDGFVEITPDNDAENTLVLQTDGPASSVTGACVTDSYEYYPFTLVDVDDACTVRVEWSAKGSEYRKRISVNQMKAFINALDSPLSIQQGDHTS